jgi:predicted RecA/RadA family phage recombinase
MATEAPLIHDGSQCTAAANYYNPSSALDGPGGSGQFLCVYISAARTVTVQTSQGGAVYGILQNTPPQGAAADVGILGVSKAVAGAAISAGANLMCDGNGRVITQTGSNVIVGVALEAASAANQIITIALVPTANLG